MIENEILLNNQNNTDKQKKYNECIGIVCELNDGEKFCSITIMAGTERPREVNFPIKKPEFDEVISRGLMTGDKVKILFFPTSKRDKHMPQRFYSNNNIIGLERMQK